MVLAAQARLAQAVLQARLLALVAVPVELVAGTVGTLLFVKIPLAVGVMKTTKLVFLKPLVIRSNWIV